VPESFWCHFFVDQYQRLVMNIFPAAELPAPLLVALQGFVSDRPDWTQERILCSALSLFLLQNGVSDRAVSQVYLQAMFGDVYMPACESGELK
jgi:hypothetical protein